jgi:hypothetical protein
MGSSLELRYLLVDPGAGKACRPPTLPWQNAQLLQDGQFMRTSISRLAVILANAAPVDRDALEAILDGTPWEIIDADETGIEHTLREAVTPIVFYNHDPACCWRKMIRALMKMRRNVCVVLVSGENEPELRQEVVRSGGFDLLTRPLRREQVLPLLLFAYSFCRGYGPYVSRTRRARAAS